MNMFFTQDFFRNDGLEILPEKIDALLHHHFRSAGPGSYGNGLSFLKPFALQFVSAVDQIAGNAKVEAMDDWRRIFREHKLRTADELTRSSEG